MPPFDQQRLRLLLSQDDRKAGRSSPALTSGGRTVIELDRPAPVLTFPATPRDRRPVASGREPCPRCATRGDFGCKHFAPSEAVMLVRDAN